MIGTVILRCPQQEHTWSLITFGLDAAMMQVPSVLQQMEPKRGGFPDAAEVLWLPQLPQLADSLICIGFDATVPDVAANALAAATALSVPGNVVLMVSFGDASTCLMTPMGALPIIRVGNLLDTATQAMVLTTMLLTMAGQSWSGVDASDVVSQLSGRRQVVAAHWQGEPGQGVTAAGAAAASSLCQFMAGYGSPTGCIMIVIAPEAWGLADWVAFAEHALPGAQPRVLVALSTTAVTAAPALLTIFGYGGPAGPA